MGCAQSTTATATTLTNTATALTNGTTQQYTFLEHSNLPAAEIRIGALKDKQPAPADAIYRKVLFQSNVTVIQKLAGDRTVETLKILDPKLTCVHHVISARMKDKSMGKNVLVSSADEHFLLCFKGSKAFATGTVYCHKLAHADDAPAEKYAGHHKLIKISASEGLQLYDSPDKSPAALVANGKFMISEAGLTAEVLEDEGTGLRLALLIGAHLLVQTQFYYRPSEKRALGSNGSIGMLMLQGAGFATNDGIRSGANQRLQYGHDATCFHGITAWADGSGSAAVAEHFDSKAGFIDKRRNVTCVVHAKGVEEDLGLTCVEDRHGVKITDVAPMSAFATAGIEAKDYLVSVNGEPTKAAGHQNALQKAGKLIKDAMSAKGAVTIVVQRGKQPGVAEQVLRTAFFA